MGLYKNIEYSVFCDTENCYIFEDYLSVDSMPNRSPRKYFKKIGWTENKTTKDWFCPKCSCKEEVR